MAQKPPSYTPREQLAISAADCIVVRVLISGDWREQEFHPDPALGETRVQQTLRRVQDALRHSPDFSNVCLYVAGTVNGERMLASMPHDPLLVPQEMQL